MKILKGILATLILLPAAANAVVIYDWEGTCDLGCQGTATGTLTLTDAYVIGTDLGQTDDDFFLSFELTADTVDFLINADTLDNTTFVFGFSPDHSIVQQFASNTADGFPYLLLRTDRTFNFGANGIVYGGFDSTWTLREVPAPATLALLGLGLAGLVGFGRRR